jgi:Ca2+-binding EF-hand superfamily protein
MTEPQLRSAMKEMDVDDSGEVDFPEFYAWWQPMVEAQKGEDGQDGQDGAATLVGMFDRKVEEADRLQETYQVAHQAFEKVDKDGSGTLDETEVAELAKSLGKVFTPEELVAAMAEMRGERPDEPEGEVTFEQFHMWWTTRDQGKSGAFAGTGMFEKLFGDTSHGRYCHSAVVIGCHWPSSLMDLHSNLAVTAASFSRNDRVALG